MKRAQGRPTVTWSPLALKRAPGNRRRSHRRPAGRRLLGRGASRPGGPRPDLLRRRQADDRFRLRFRRRGGDRAPAGRQDRRGRRHARHRRRLRPRPLQPQRHARHELLRRRQADDRLRGRATQANGVALQADGRSSWSATGGRRLRPRPLQPQRLARHELLRRRQADDRLRRARPSERRWRSRATARSSWSAPAVASDFALARYNSNGSLDTSFSGDGKQTTDFGGATANAVALQADGKIVAVGGSGARLDFALARYNPNGSLDTSFSGDGKQTTDFGWAATRANGVAIQANGKIVAVGSRWRGIGSDFALARYNPNGTLDTSFSGDGKQTTDFGGSDAANGVALQATARSSRSADRRPAASFVLARYNPNGSLDTSFSGDGKQTTDFAGAPTGRTRWRSRATARSSRSAAGGCRPTSPSPATTPNGSLDPSFSGDGKQTTDFAASTRRTGVALQGDGKIVAVGGTAAERATTSRSPATTRTARSTRASPATASRRPTSGASTTASGVALQADGKIVAVGRTAAPATPATSPSPATTRTARSTRASPATASRRPTSEADSTWRPAVALQADGKIVVVGYSFNGTTTSPSPATTPTARSTRPSPATASRPPTSAGNDRASRGGAPGRRQDRRWSVDAGADFALARYNPNGSLDTSFSGDGKQTTDFGADSDGRTRWRSRRTARSSRSAARAAASTATSRSPATTRTARSTRASPATASRRPTSAGFDAANGVAIQGDGKIVAAGGGGAGGDFALARYNPNGSLDTSFSGDGKQTTDFGGAGERRPAWRSKATARSSRPGSASASTRTRDFALARYKGS